LAIATPPPPLTSVTRSAEPYTAVARFHPLPLHRGGYRPPLPGTNKENPKRGCGCRQKTEQLAEIDEEKSNKFGKIEEQEKKKQAKFKKDSI